MLPLKILKFRVSEIASSDFESINFYRPTDPFINIEVYNQSMDFPIRRSSDLLSFDVTCVVKVLHRGCGVSFTPAFACLKISLNSLIFQINRIFTFFFTYIHLFFARACNSNNLVLFSPVVLGCHVTGLVFHAFKLTLFSSNSAFALSNWTRVSSNLAPAKLRCSHVAASIWGNCTS